MSKSPLSLYSSYYVDSKVDPAAVTNYGGIFPYLDVMLLTGLPKLSSEYLPEKSMRGWQHAEHIGALLALNLTGGDCVDDLVKLDGDAGIGLYMGQIAQALEGGDRQFSRGGDRNVPSLTSVWEWLEQFHNADEDAKRGYGHAFVPEANESLCGLRKVNREFVSRGWRLYQRSGRSEAPRATLEIDASFMETQKRDALCCYKRFDAYSCLTVRWAEMGFAVWDEFRDGNVPPAYRNLEALTESITYLNEELGITDVWVRSDAAANKFGVNAAWWSIVVLAHNLHALLEKLAMPKGLVGSRFKRLRYHLINVPARLVTHARQCCVRYFQATTLQLVQYIRGEIAALKTASG